MSDCQASTRRAFVVGGLASVAAVGLSGCGGGGGGSGSVTSAAPAPAAALPPLTMSEVGEWEGLVGNTFRIATNRGEISAVLVALERAGADLNRPSSLARSQPFVAFFEMPLDSAPIGDTVYRVLHSTKGGFDLFLGQVNRSRGRDVMIAILN